jgi:hypothetical protein
MFVDQKWMDFAPSLCPDVCVLREKTFNVAYWNLHERQVQFVAEKPFIAGAPLVFFHFSGLPPRGDQRISKYQTRFSLDDRPDVAPLFARYRDKLEGNGHLAYLKLPYGFGGFSDGMPISGLARRIVIDHPMFSASPDPFAAKGELRAVLARAGVLRRNAKVSGSTSSATASANERVRLQRVIGVGFRIFLRLLGAARYERLMRYLARIASLRQQTFLIEN